MTRAFYEVYGIADAFKGLRMAGGLDLDFTETVFERHPELDRSLLPNMFEVYYEYLKDEVAGVRTELLPGVADILAQSEKIPWLFNALGTGNLERGARIKLEPFGLNRYLPVGGFCEVPTERWRVLQNGVKNAAAFYGVDFAPEQVIVIGDTVRDIVAARQIGAHVVAVATGGSEFRDLEKERPDALTRDLGDTERFFETCAVLTQQDIERRQDVQDTGGFQ